MNTQTQKKVAQLGSDAPAGALWRRRQPNTQDLTISASVLPKNAGNVIPSYTVHEGNMSSLY